MGPRGGLGSELLAAHSRAVPVLGPLALLSSTLKDRVGGQSGRLGGQEPCLRDSSQFRRSTVQASKHVHWEGGGSRVSQKRGATIEVATGRSCWEHVTVSPAPRSLQMHRRGTGTLPAPAGRLPVAGRRVEPGQLPSLGRDAPSALWRVLGQRADAASGLSRGMPVWSRSHSPCLCPRRWWRGLQAWVPVT